MHLTHGRKALKGILNSNAKANVSTKRSGRGELPLSPARRWSPGGRRGGSTVATNKGNKALYVLVLRWKRTGLPQALLVGCHVAN